MSMRSILRSLATTAVSAAALLAAMPTAPAQVRNEPAPGALVDPSVSPATRALFERSGIFMIAGGVLPAGHATFLMEQNGTETPVPAQDIQLATQPGGRVALVSAGITYQLGIPAGMACPLGQFIGRDGLIAYTIPKYMDPDSRRALSEAGLAHHRIAREFESTLFAPLLRAADFGDTEPLDPRVAEKITNGINRGNGLHGLILDASFDLDKLVGSYLNSDMQVTYRVYLQPATKSVEIGGVPLRYYWSMDRSGVGGVFSVEAYAQNWAPDAKLSNLAAPGVRPTQYDVVNFFQVAAVFRQMHETAPAAFAGFTARACASTSP